MTVSITSPSVSGNATLSAKDKDVEVDGTASVSKSKKATEVVFNCKIKKLPTTVRLLEKHRFAWTLKIDGGGPARNINATILTLYILDDKPKKVSGKWWDPENKDLYDWVLDYSCLWANGKTGADRVFEAIWNKFSTGTQARVPHETNWIYWKKRSCVQALFNLRYQGRAMPYKGGKANGWSCKAICHFFMMSIAAHGLDCQSVVPTGSTMSFLVAKWTLVGAGGDPANVGLPGPLSAGLPAGVYYAGNWSTSAPGEMVVPPRPRADRKGWHRDADRAEPPHPGQGQSYPPLYFGNHWILDLKCGPAGLYDTSYGGKHIDKGPSGPTPAGVLLGPLGAYQAEAISGWVKDLQGRSLIVVKPNRDKMYDDGPDAST